MAETWTIRSMLTWLSQDLSAQGVDTPRLDAELLIAHVLRSERVKLYMDFDRPLMAAELAELRALTVRRRKREPVAYLIGRREFYKRAFEVSNAVLIPRPDTETLVERALELLAPDAAARALDLCTGSGAIAISLAAERPQLHVTATDLSAAALEVASRNAVRHGVADRIELREGDLFAALPSGTRYDLIVANPPYVSDSEMPALAPELHHEPALALRAGDTGLDVLRRLCEQSADWLAPDASLLFEVGAGQASEISELLRNDSRLRAIRTYKDLGGVERVVEAVRN
jgi:release factor glutamine methyltransferase